MHDSRAEFRHPLARSAIYGDAPADQRRAVHRAVASALPDADADRRAWHLALAAIGPDDAASSALEQAGQRAYQRSAYEVSSRAFERAALLAPEEDRYGRLMYAAADAAWLGGLADRAVALLDQAGRHVPDPGLAVAIEHLRGHIAIHRGPVTEGQEILLAAAERAAPIDPERAVVMLAEAAYASFCAGDAATMLQAAERAASLVPPDPNGHIAWHCGASGTLGTARLDAAVEDDARGMLAQGLTGIRRYGEHGERRGDTLSVFVNCFAPAPRMLVFGAIDFAAAVARAGKFLGYHVTVCDARKVFATASRFPDADEVVVDWPHRFLAGTQVDARTVICVLTHDPKFDVPLLEVALRTPAAYIGAMGSRRTHHDRLGRLREAGLTSAELSRLRSPIGLDLGARTPEETAVSIAAELIQLRWGGTGQALTDTQGRIHHQLALS
jgi:xanthine/CO dehydrogenase XdhC/CoxF family maturation factor